MLGLFESYTNKCYRLKIAALLRIYVTPEELIFRKLIENGVY